MDQLSLLERWAKRLQNLTVSHLPSDYTRPSPARLVEAALSRSIDPEVQLALFRLVLQGTNDSQSTSPFTILLSAFIVLVQRLTGDEDISVGTSSEGGDPFVLRCRASPTESFTSLLRTVKQAEAEGASDPVDFNDLVDYMSKSDSNKNADRESPLFHLRFYNTPDAPSSLFLASTETNTDLTIFVALETTNTSLRSASALPSMKLIVRYNQLLFSADRIACLIDQLTQIVIDAGGDPDKPIGALRLLTERQLKILPDPSIDLHWGEFKGAIHEIFAANALRHPERQCVVETAISPNSRDRVFTYRDIHESSNILAHYLVTHSVIRGDVVMVYAHRGVDLVVAVMGILKAGATFSVIDPAYPPARQNIYLTVANPAALIVIEKAGLLSPTVKHFIARELALKAQIPSLALQQDGTLRGDGKKDIFKDQFQFKSHPPKVVIGPDSTPTLSFTSGSEGVPKGVRGRHFSLTYYFPWMAETFGLSENDRFTMLSGIAHDPIQRDIFTPLFLGASLFVPTADDIGTPGRLAEWMNNVQATVTHLTPAMGQLLSTEATRSIPSLRNAFFVGDVLTKRDCLRLQSLASNVTIINMYGTTETQRAVSYFPIPPVSADPVFLNGQKDIIPAGRGMTNVQLLVVNRTDRNTVCGVGEIGELFVRAAGLAEGYLKLPELTKQKFITNWMSNAPAFDQKHINEPWAAYYLGPRDRLYRTGDLGRYLPNGDGKPPNIHTLNKTVECSGRADDQVKIRGFRIELGEIDTYLTQHPLVRENVTLVRRDKDEEPTLVSYIVPQQSSELNELLSDEDGGLDLPNDELVQGLRKYRKLIRDIRDHLKSKLPSYAIPTVFVPLMRMPLNPNGKVDKPALPFPDTAQLAAASRQSRKDNIANETVLSSTQQTVRDIWLGVIPHAAQDIEVTDNFFDIGGHSILATRVVFEIRKRFAIDLPLGILFRQPTIAGLSEEIDLLRGGSLDMISRPPSSHGNLAPEYSLDAISLMSRLPNQYTKRDNFSKEDSITVMLTGATGFLGAFLIRDLLTRPLQNIRIIAHVRAKTTEGGLQRIKNTCEAYGVWKNDWPSRIEVVTGSLESDYLGLSKEKWNELSRTVDIVIHNGAMVHWVYPYAQMRGPNVLGTLSAMSLCESGKAKRFVFISSTSVLDTEHYVRLSDSILAKGGEGVLESDDLQGSRETLPTGYGQTKWVSEQLVMEAGRRGLHGVIVRPGYIVGDSNTGVTNTDDFIVRLIKGCVQLGLVPEIYNTVNMVPVDHVARIVTASAFHPVEDTLSVIHVTGHPRSRFVEILSSLSEYGFPVVTTDYMPWRIALERYTILESKDNALYPLLHFVLDNLPQSTKAPELDDRNACTILKADIEWSGVDMSQGRGVTLDEMGIYLAYLVGIGFLDAPSAPAKRPLPDFRIDKQNLAKLTSVGGRGTKT